MAIWGVGGLTWTVKVFPDYCCGSALKKGSDSLLVQRSGLIGRRHQPRAQQIELGASIHLAFDELQLRDLSFRLPVGPRLNDGAFTAAQSSLKPLAKEQSDVFGAG